MPRGHFWEMTYDPHWEGPTKERQLEDLDGSSGYVEAIVLSSSEARVRWTGMTHSLHFQRCDLRVTLVDSLVSNCTFSGCRFRGSTWSRVKFSNCVFDGCDFSEAYFTRCHFVDSCRFSGNSASA